MMRKNKKYYFKKENFLSISNLLCRLKSNAVSLATITVLCSGVILTIFVSYTLGQGLQKARIDNDFELAYDSNQSRLNKEDIESEPKKIDSKLDKSIDRKYFVSYSSIIETTDDGEIILDIDPGDSFSSNNTFFTVTTQDYYERAYGNILDDLEDNEIYYVSSNNWFNKFKKIKIEEKAYSIKPIEDKSDKKVVFGKNFYRYKGF